MAEQTSDMADPRVVQSPVQLTWDELAGVSLLSNVAAESVFGLLCHCAVIDAPPGVELISPKRPQGSMYVVLRGLLAVYIDAGRDEPVAQFSAGQCVGEIGVVDARPGTAYVVTVEPSRLLVVDEATFWRLVRASHAFCANMLHLLAQRLRLHNAQLNDSVKRSRVLERDAMTDALTGLHNRRWLEQRLPRFIARHQRASRQMSVLMIDIDHFKRVNDDFGHVAGDDILSAVGNQLLAQIRPTDVAVRYGGEEMLLVLPDTGIKGARLAAQRLRTAIAAIRVPSVDRAVTVSVGIAQVEERDTAQSLIQRADEKLYLAKSNGRDRVEG